MDSRYWVESNDGHTAILRVTEGRKVAGDGEKFVYRNTEGDINLSPKDFLRTFPVHGFVTQEAIAELNPAPENPYAGMTWAPELPEQPAPDQSEIDAAESLKNATMPHAGDENS